MLLNNLQFRGDPPMTVTYPVPNINCTEVEKPSVVGMKPEL